MNQEKLIETIDKETGKVGIIEVETLTIEDQREMIGVIEIEEITGEMTEIGTNDRNEATEIGTIGIGETIVTNAKLDVSAREIMVVAAITNTSIEIETPEIMVDGQDLDLAKEHYLSNDQPHPIEKERKVLQRLDKLPKKDAQ